MRPLLVLRPAIAVLLIGSTLGCGASTVGPSDVRPVTIDREYVTGVATQEVTGFHPRLHLVIPRIPQAVELNRRISGEAAQWQRSFLVGAADNAELSVSWQPLAVSSRVIGIELQQDWFAGASGSNASHSHWYDVRTGRLRSNLDLVASRRALATSITRALEGRQIFRSALKSLLASSGPPFLGFADDGQLVAGFDDSQIGPTATNLAVVPLGRVALSRFGRLARAAALHPRPVALPAAPRPAVPATPVPVDCRRKRCVALTFDDGPGPYTSRLLAILRDKRARATFFLLGQQVDTYPQIVRQLVAAGHEFGNHTWDHRDLTRLSDADRVAEIVRTTSELRHVTGLRSHLFRPPYGSRNRAVDRIARDQRYAEILWDVDTLDWRDRNSAVVRARVLREARAGSIVLMHDIHPTTVAAVASIIDGLRAKGFTLVTLSQLLGTKLQPGKRYFRLTGTSRPKPAAAREEQR